MKIILITIFTFSFLLFSLQFARAASSISAIPVVFDFKAKARDVIKEKIRLANNSDYKLGVYAFVNNILPESGREEFLSIVQTDLSSSLANWIKVSRGVIEFAPKESREINIEIEVNMRAKPGIYHAEIAFAAGGSREEAEKNLAQAAKVMVNLEVLEDAKEQVWLRKFAPDRTFFSGLPINFTYILENVGNKTVVPVGEIRIYDRRGAEAASIPLNQESQAIDPGEVVTFSGAWTNGQKLGKFKALLFLEYGEKPGTLQDTAFFWILPLKEILITFGIVSFFLVLITVYLHKGYVKHKI